MSDEAVVRCTNCRGVLQRVEEVPHPDGAAHLEFYSCPGCHRKAVLWWELKSSLASEARGWVEREVARRGAFFPSDYR